MTIMLFHITPLCFVHSVILPPATTATAIHHHNHHCHLQPPPQLNIPFIYNTTTTSAIHHHCHLCHHHNHHCHLQPPPQPPLLPPKTVASEDKHIISFSAEIADYSVIVNDLRISVFKFHEPGFILNFLNTITIYKKPSQPITKLARFANTIKPKSFNTILPRTSEAAGDGKLAGEPVAAGKLIGNYSLRPCRFGILIPFLFNSFLL
ncbi:hypothetical protein Hanom_Chr12g01171421 [Helianthus anomalus]